MKLSKTNMLLSLVNDYLVDSPSPSNLSYFWNFGSLLGLNFIIVVVSGITLAMHYTPHVDYAFSSVEHIMRDVNNGWLIRYIHANGASFFFIYVYIHIARGLYYGSYRAPRRLLWNLGVIIYLLMMAIAFMGYILPWGQMSFWGATVITNLFSAIPWIGPELVGLLWGGFSVDNATLNRFFSLHYLLPFVLAGAIMLHLRALHVNASNNPEGISSFTDKIRFHPYFTSKDLVGFFLALIIFSSFIFFEPNYLGHPDNNIPANALVTPSSIQPEWYYLPFYAILRAVPDKLGGVIAMFSSILILFTLSTFHNNTVVRSLKYRPVSRLLFWVFVANFFFLLILGAKPIEEPYVILGQLSTTLYFLYFIFLSIIGWFQALPPEGSPHLPIRPILHMWWGPPLFEGVVSCDMHLFIFSDYPISNSMSNFQDPANNNMLAIINLHDYIVFYLIFVSVVVMWIASSVFYHSGKNLDHFRDLSHGNLIETIWTISPAIILWLIGIPSLKLLYIMDNLYDSQLTIQIVGNQWYWSYTYSDYEDISYDSFLVDESDLEMGDLRMLTVDNYLVLPINTNIRLLITSNDVVHSFAIPSLGVKCDAVPGRLNSVGLIINRPSVFYGQCSELCGILHGFMPIGVKGVTLNEYLMYISSLTSE